MELTKKEALERSKELWRWLAETGKMKGEWPEWERYSHVEMNCFLCEYDRVRSKDDCSCDYCPLYLKLEVGCWNTAFGNWDDANTPEDRKKYAKLFLEVLETL